MSLTTEFERYKNILEPELLKSFDNLNISDNLNEAMKYSLMAGGKRVRPALVFAATEALGAPAEKAIPAASALEMIHTYSLIHDDLPAMDNDDLRRGKPTCHKKFGEALAILAGDGLLTQAFVRLADPRWNISPENKLQVITAIATGAGAVGMVAGQVLDMEFEGKACTEQELEKIHNHKTGKLLLASVVSGALCGDANAEQLQRFRTYGECIGLAFQIADDILDLTATTEELGKDSKSDLKKQKATYPSVIGMEKSQRRAADLLAQALDAISPFGEKAKTLSDLARFIVERRA